MSFLENLDTSILADLLPQESKKKLPLITCTVEGLVEEKDLAEYCELVSKGEVLSPENKSETDVQQLRARHHSVARLLAAGTPEGVVAAITRYSPAYISNLKHSPAMQELIAHYRGPHQEAAQVLGEKLRVMADQATDLLMEKMVNEPDELTPTELVAISKLGHDRSGMGPSSKLDVNAQHTVVDLAELQRLRNSVREAESPRISRTVTPLLPSLSKDDDDADAA